jgi:hypothetical protein
MIVPEPDDFQSCPGTTVQQQSAATAPTGNDQIWPVQISDLPQRALSTALPLDGKEMINSLHYESSTTIGCSTAIGDGGRSIGLAGRTLYREPSQSGYRAASQSYNPGEEGADE